MEQNQVQTLAELPQNHPNIANLSRQEVMEQFVLCAAAAGLTALQREAMLDLIIPSETKTAPEPIVNDRGTKKSTVPVPVTLSKQNKPAASETKHDLLITAEPVELTEVLESTIKLVNKTGEQIGNLQAEEPIDERFSLKVKHLVKEQESLEHQTKEKVEALGDREVVYEKPPQDSLTDSESLTMETSAGIETVELTAKSSQIPFNVAKPTSFRPFSRHEHQAQKPANKLTFQPDVFIEPSLAFDTSFDAYELESSSFLYTPIKGESTEAEQFDDEFTTLTYELVELFSKKTPVMPTDGTIEEGLFVTTPNATEESETHIEKPSLEAALIVLAENFSETTETEAIRTETIEIIDTIRVLLHSAEENPDTQPKITPELIQQVMELLESVGIKDSKEVLKIYAEEHSAEDFIKLLTVFTQDLSKLIDNQSYLIASLQKQLQLPAGTISSHLGKSVLRLLQPLAAA